jgi:hypothetical protein
VKNIEAPEVPQRSDRNKLNMQLVERMLNFVEARLESKLSGLEKLISRNVKNLRTAKAEVNRIEKLTEIAHDKELKITLVSDDIRFFFHLAKKKQLDILEGDEFWQNNEDFVKNYQRTEATEKQSMTKSQQRVNLIKKH